MANYAQLPTVPMDVQETVHTTVQVPLVPSVPQGWSVGPDGSPVSPAGTPFPPGTTFDASGAPILGAATGDLPLTSIAVLGGVGYFAGKSRDQAVEWGLAGAVAGLLFRPLG